MINIKESIYTALNNNPLIQSLVGESIKTWADGKDVRDGTGDIFPMITYYRVNPSKMHNQVGVRVEIFQISVWSESMAQGEQISNAVVELFNRTMNDSWKSCQLVEARPDSYDIDTKTYGIHKIFSFVVYDPSY